MFDNTVGRNKKVQTKNNHDIWKEFDEIKAPLLGYILDVLVKVMAWKKEHGSPSIQLSRMADWTEYSELIARCIGYKDNDLVEAYNENEGLRLDEVLNSNPVSTVLIKYMTILAETTPKDYGTQINSHQVVKRTKKTSRKYGRGY